MTSTASSHKKYTSLAFKRVFKSRIVNMILALGASIVAVIIAISATIVQNNFTYAQAKKVIGDTDITFEEVRLIKALEGKSRMEQDRLIAEMEGHLHGED